MFAHALMRSKGTRVLPSCASRRRRALRYIAEALESRRLLNSITWSGAIDGNWNTPGNWAGGQLPQSGDDLVFDGSALQKSTIDNIPGPHNFRSIKIQADGYSIAGVVGNSLTLTAGTSTVDKGVNGVNLRPARSTPAGKPPVEAASLIRRWASSSPTRSSSGRRNRTAGGVGTR